MRILEYSERKDFKLNKFVKMLKEYEKNVKHSTPLTNFDAHQISLTSEYK